MSYTPFEWTENLIIGSVDFVSPDEIRVLLDIEAPDSLSLNTGNPHPFPRVNSYVLIPIDEGYLVGQVEWITIERAAFPKRQGMKDFGLVDLPFPLRKISVNPLGTLYKKEGNIYNFKRGSNSLPTVGTPVFLPTAKQIEAIVEGDKTKKMRIGTSPFAGEANIYVDPNKLFGRHLTVLGNTGSGKSCSVAGLIHWSLEAAQKERKNKNKEGIPNARFIILDPNGEYSYAFNSAQSSVKSRVFKVDIGDSSDTNNGENPLKVPIWFWNREEWLSFTHASAKIQKPLLMRALRKVRMLNCYNENLQDVLKTHLIEHLRVILKLLRRAKSPELVQKSEKNIYTQLGKNLDLLIENLKDKGENILTLLDIDNVVLEYYIDGIESNIKDKRIGELGNTKYYFEGFSLDELEQIERIIKEIAAKLGSVSDVMNEINNEINEDIPIAFDAVNFVKNLEDISIEEDAGQYLEPLIMRIHMLLSNLRLKSIIDDKDEPVELAKWLEDYIGGNNAGNGNVVIIDLSLVPSEIIYVITAVIARMIFEALQRYRKLKKYSLPTVLVMEEAHTFIKRYRDDEEDGNAAKVCTQIFERIAREGRKFGLSLVISSQRPSELSPTVLSQCNTFLLHRITNDRDQEMISKLVSDNLRGLLRELPILPTQMAILLGWATELPVLVRMRDLPESQRPRSDDPDLWDVWVGENEEGSEVKREIDWHWVAYDWQGGCLKKEISSEVKNKVNDVEAAVTLSEPNIEIGEIKLGNTVLIVGAGVEKTKGLNMPLANELITELIKFTENQGKQVSECLRKKLPNVRFSFRSLVKEGMDSILHSEPEKNDKLTKRLENLKNSGETLRIKLLYKILTQLSSIKKGNYIDEETINIIKDLFTEEDIIDLTDNNLLDLKYFTFSDAFRKILIRLLEESIGLKPKSNESTDEALYNLLMEEFLDFEKLLVNTFIGFYTKKKSDIKKYIYISWILWSYFVWRELTTKIDIGEIPFYNTIPDEWAVITFNYTSFLSKAHKKSIYFHGSCDEYIRMDNRNVLPTNYLDFKNIDNIIEFLDKYIKLDFEEELYFIPSIIPPLKLKPVISTKFLDKWYEGKKFISTSERIIIVGYSFSSADEHINDILRENKDKEVVIINPAFKKIISAIKNIYRVVESNFSEFDFLGKRALKADNITIIDAYAGDFPISDLQQL